MEDVISLFDPKLLLVLAVVVLASERSFEVFVNRVIDPLGRLLFGSDVEQVQLFKDVKQLLSWVWSGLFTLATGIDMFAGMVISPWGTLLTCLIAGAGSNAFHELLGALQGIKIWGRNGSS